VVVVAVVEAADVAVVLVEGGTPVVLMIVALPMP